MIRIMVIALLLSGCSIKTTITDPDGRIYIVKSRKNALIEYKEKDVEIKIDNRGNRGFIEQVFGALLIDSKPLSKD